MTRIALACSAALTAAALVAGGAGAGGTDQGRTWRLTISNLTPPGSQPLSPPLVAVHSQRVDVWSVGEIASHGVAAIAEDANNAVLESALPQLSGVRSVQTVAGGPIPPGGSRTFVVETGGRFDRVSLVTMLVNTNDAFTGLDAVHLGGRGGGLLFETMAYDAGSERNNERAAFIPGPCCNNPFVRDPEGELIRHHGGITGVGDLNPATYDWNDPVARITVQPAG